VAEAFTDAGIFRMCRPRSLGGLELDPLAMMQVIEELSRVDGAAGWCAMIHGTGAAFDAYIPLEGARAMYADPRAVTGGVLAPTGRAVPVEGGYRVSGRWSIASGCHHCDWLGGTAVVLDGEAPRVGPGGMPETIVPMFGKSDFTIVDTWSVAGLAGTGSHDFEVDDAFVPASRVIRLMSPPFHDAPLFRFPFFSLLATGIASVALGIARAALDELYQVARTKTPFRMQSTLAHRPSAQLAAAEAEATLRSGRAFLVEVVQRAWDAALAGEPPTVQQRLDVRLAASHATKSAVAAVDAAFTAGGASALYTKSPLQRCFRDVHTVTQHFWVAPPTDEMFGRLLLGAEPDSPML
jgi:alkylation response protein AidB-like acyl-CoA dehydrogenase